MSQTLNQIKSLRGSLDMVVVQQQDLEARMAQNLRQRQAIEQQIADWQAALAMRYDTTDMKPAAKDAFMDVCPVDLINRQMWQTALGQKIEQARQEQLALEIMAGEIEAQLRALLSKHQVLSVTLARLAAEHRRQAEEEEADQQSHSWVISSRYM